MEWQQQKPLDYRNIRNWNDFVSRGIPFYSMNGEGYQLSMCGSDPDCGDATFAEGYSYEDLLHNFKEADLRMFHLKQVNSFYYQQEPKSVCRARYGIYGIVWEIRDEAVRKAREAMQSEKVA